jgi:hypothetical protein
MVWLQSSRINWLKEGDRNTKYEVCRAQKNKIAKLCGDNGIVQTTPTEMQLMVVSYFKSMYTRDPSINDEFITSLIQEQVTPEMNTHLCMDFSDEEICNALFQIGPIKAPGPDGFHARLYQQNWGLLRIEISRLLNGFLKQE